MTTIARVLCIWVTIYIKPESIAYIKMERTKMLCESDIYYINVQRAEQCGGEC